MSGFAMYLFTHFFIIVKYSFDFDLSEPYFVTNCCWWWWRSLVLNLLVISHINLSSFFWFQSTPNFFIWWRNQMIYRYCCIVLRRKFRDEMVSWTRPNGHVWKFVLFLFFFLDGTYSVWILVVVECDGHRYIIHGGTSRKHWPFCTVKPSIDIPPI